MHHLDHFVHILIRLRQLLQDSVARLEDADTRAIDNFIVPLRRISKRIPGIRATC